jgi:uncharacterized membrane protein YfcA
MDHISLEMLSFLLGAGFVAAFIDSVVGGGGLISMPALLMTGLPPSVVLGTNKLASICCSSTSSISFLRSGKMDLGLVKYLFPLIPTWLCIRSLYGTADSTGIFKTISYRYVDFSSHLYDFQKGLG